MEKFVANSCKKRKQLLAFDCLNLFFVIIFGMFSQPMITFSSITKTLFYFQRRYKNAFLCKFARKIQSLWHNKKYSE